MTAQVGGTFSSDKAALRRELRTRRRLLSPAAQRRAARAAAAHMLALLTRLRARRVGVYLRHGSELDTAPLIALLRASGREVYVPRVVDDQRMQLCRLPDVGGLRRGPHGIREPVVAAFVPAAGLDAAVLPLLGFDLRGGRLGTGGGYYDRWLADAPRSRPHRVGYAFWCQHVPEVPLEPWDIRLHTLITERGIVRCGP